MLLLLLFWGLGDDQLLPTRTESALGFTDFMTGYSRRLLKVIITDHSYKALLSITS